MMEDEKNLKLPGFEDIEPTSAALIRSYQETGETWELTREIIALLGDRGHYVYNMQIRWPKHLSKDVLLIVKVFSEEGSFVAFHAGVTWTHLVPTFAARVRAGSVSWVKDDYPPDKWEEWFHVLVRLPRIRR